MAFFLFFFFFFYSFCAPSFLSEFFLCLNDSEAFAGQHGEMHRDMVSGEDKTEVVAAALGSASGLPLNADADADLDVDSIYAIAMNKTSAVHSSIMLWGIWLDQRR